MVNREEICIVGWSGDVRPFLCHREERGSRDNQKALLGRGLTWVKGSSGMSGGWAESPILHSWTQGARGGWAGQAQQQDPSAFLSWPLSSWMVLLTF